MGLSVKLGLVGDYWYFASAWWDNIFLGGWWLQGWALGCPWALVLGFERRAFCVVLCAGLGLDVFCDFLRVGVA